MDSVAALIGTAIGGAVVEAYRKVTEEPADTAMSGTLYLHVASVHWGGKVQYHTKYIKVGPTLSLTHAKEIG